MGRHEHGRACGCGVVNQLPELTPRDRIDAARGLVEEDDARLVNQGNRERELLSPPQRKAAHGDVGDLREAESREHLLGALTNLVAGQPVDAAVQADVLTGRQVLVEREALAHVPDAALHGLALRCQVVAGDAGGAARRLQQADQHANGSRLACTVRAEEAEDLAGLHLERDAIDCREVTEAARQLVRVNGRVAHGAPSVRAMKLSSTVGASGSTEAPANPCANRKVFTSSTMRATGASSRASV